MDTVNNQSITSLPRSPEEDRRARMIKYSLAMGIRMVCIVSLLFVHGWWLVVMGIGAIVLPYIAVVLANVGSTPGGAVEAPTGREVMVRDPLAPVIVPPVENASDVDTSASRPRSTGFGAGGTGDRSTGDPGFDDRGFDGGTASPFASPAASPFGQSGRPSSASPYVQYEKRSEPVVTFEQKLPSPADRPTEGQA